jgi:hypothetical protein
MTLLDLRTDYPKPGTLARIPLGGEVRHQV